MSKRTATGFLVVIAAVLFSAPFWGCDDGTTGMDRPSDGTIDFSGGVVVTDGWAGEWNVVVTFRDCGSGATTMVEDVVDLVCPADTIRLAGTGLFEGCTGTATDHSLSAACEYEFADGDCHVIVSMTLQLDRDGEGLAGSGILSTATSVDCGDPYTLGCESFSITGTRLSSDTSPCNMSLSDPDRRGLLAPLLGRARGAALRPRGGSS